MNIKTKIKRVLRDKTVFMIVKYNIAFGGYSDVEYSIVTLMPDRRTIATYIIPDREAKAVIAEKDMAKVSSNRYGQIWELPATPFKKRFKGKYLDFES